MRRPRLELPGIPLHITQRGVNRGATFIDDDDHRAYLDALQRAAMAQGVSVHGWALMGNHVHLLASAEAAGAVSRMMQAIGRRYVRAFNAMYARTGTLWEGRFRSCLVDSERYLLTCLRYIELNPVRLGWWRCRGITAGPACTRTWACSPALYRGRTRRMRRSARTPQRARCTTGNC